VCLADVVEGQHYEREKQDRGNCADPVGMGHKNPVLIRGCGVPHHLQRAEVGGDEAKSRDPHRHLAASHKKFLGRLSETPQVHTQTQNQNEVQDNDDEVNGIEGKARFCRLKKACGWHLFCAPGSLYER